MSAILQLPLQQQWWNLIETGEKKEEYREIKAYWYDRITNAYIVSCIEGKPMKVCFRRGYTKDTMTFIVNKISIGHGKPEWGAPEDKDVFIISLGERV